MRVHLYPWYGEHQKFYHFRSKSLVRNIYCAKRDAHDWNLDHGNNPEENKACHASVCLCQIVQNSLPGKICEKLFQCTHWEM